MSQIFGEIRQIAFVVRDVDRAMEYWAKTLGIGPFFVEREIEFSEYRYRGQPCASPKVTIALANSGYVQVELIQQHDDLPSIYKEFLDSCREGLQHVSAWLSRAEFDNRKAQLLQRGLEIAQECTIPSSGVRLAYFSTDGVPGGLVYEISDILEPSQYEWVQKIAEAAVNWNGKQTVVEVKA